MLTNESGRVYTEQVDLERIVCEFYQRLFTAQDQLQPELIGSHVPRKVTREMCEILSHPFSEEEVELALFQMAPSKAPRVDDFNAGFFSNKLAVGEAVRLTSGAWLSEWW